MLCPKTVVFGQAVLLLFIGLKNKCCLLSIDSPLHPNQEIATARDINLLRAINFLEGKPIAKTRIPRLVKLAH
jgi:hypothetical protein